MTQRSCGFNQSLELHHMLEISRKKLLSRYEILPNSIICIVLLVIIQIDRLAKSATFISFPSYAKPHMTQRSCGFNQSLELPHMLEISPKKLLSFPRSRDRFCSRSLEKVWTLDRPGSEPSTMMWHFRRIIVWKSSMDCPHFFFKRKFMDRTLQKNPETNRFMH